MYSTLFLVLTLLYSVPDNAVYSHDIHLSRTEINIDAKSGDLQISMHIFADDLDLALTKKYQKKYHIATEKEDPEGDNVIERYLKEVFRLSAGGKILSYNYLGKEAGGEELAVWIYLEVENPGKIESLTVEQKLLFELYSDQKNIIDIKNGKIRKGFSIMDRQKSTEFFKW